MPAATKVTPASQAELDESPTDMDVDAKKPPSSNQLHCSDEDQKTVEILTELLDEYGVPPFQSDMDDIEKGFVQEFRRTPEQEFRRTQNDCAPSIPSIFLMTNETHHDAAPAAPDMPQPVVILDILIELSSYPGMATASEGGATVISAHIRQMYSDNLVDMAYTNVNMPNSYGQTALAVLVHRQDIAAVITCCLFSPDGNCGSLFAALAEAALLPSDEIFFTLLRKICRSEGAEVALHDRPLGGWLFLNSNLCKFTGCSLEETLQLVGSYTHRLDAVRLAKAIGVDSVIDV